MKAAPLRIFVFAPLFCLLTAGIGCSRSNSQTPEKQVGDSKASFAFDWKYAQSLTLTKADPRSGDHWMARVERQQDKPTTFYETDPWTIATYSENAALPDRLANRNYIEHLLDTLGTFHATAVVDADGSSETARANYGLTPPRYALEWKAWNEQTQQAQTFRVEIGNPVDPSHPLNSESYGSFPPSRKIYKVDGAAIAMLDYLKNFSGLRQITLSPLTSDDVDEIEIDRAGKKVFYAQRDGERWTNEDHRPWKKDVGAFLDRITHLRIAKFLDSESDFQAARTRLAKKPLEQIVLKDRTGKPTVLRFALDGSRPLADVSTRGTGVFELYPGALEPKEPKNTR